LKKLVIPGGLQKSSRERVVFLEFNTKLSQTLGLNMMYPSPSHLSDIFQVFDDLCISEEDRLQAIAYMDTVLAESRQPGERFPGKFVLHVLFPIYKALINWKSGHIEEGLAEAISCLLGLQVYTHETFFGALSHFPQLCMMGNLVKFFLEQGHLVMAAQMYDYIKSICKVMEPEYNFVTNHLNELMAKHGGTSTPISSPSSADSSPTSTPPAQIYYGNVHIYKIVDTINKITISDFNNSDVAGSCCHHAFTVHPTSNSCSDDYSSSSNNHNHIYNNTNTNINNNTTTNNNNTNNNNNDHNYDDNNDNTYLEEISVVDFDEIESIINGTDYSSFTLPGIDM